MSVPWILNVVPPPGHLLRHTLIAMSFLGLNRADAGEPAMIEVRFAITDSDSKPLQRVPARVVIGDASVWQQADAGHRFTTDEHGEHHFTTAAKIERRSRKLPTSFVDGLFSRPKPTDFLQVGTELEYAGRRWLYVIEIHRFQDGTSLSEHPLILSADARGNFNQRAERIGADWKLMELDGLVLDGPGNDVVTANLQANLDHPAGLRWTLHLGFKRAAEPIRR